MPEPESPAAGGGETAILACQDLVLGYRTASGWKEVVHGVSFEAGTGETLALVGESGSGKTTIARGLVKLVPVRSGSMRLDGEEVAPLGPAAFQRFRKTIQLVFQDPWHALNPRLSAQELLVEPLELHFPGLSGRQRRERISGLLETVHLPASVAGRYPSELSGGQRQRLLLARALAVEPRILVLDEPVSALDVSIQAQLLQLLAELKASRRLTLVFISHDLAVVQQMADRVLVLQGGHAVEWRPAGALFADPAHPYTRTLIEACPKW